MRGGSLAAFAAPILDSSRLGGISVPNAMAVMAAIPARTPENPPHHRPNLLRHGDEVSDLDGMPEAAGRTDGAARPLAASTLTAAKPQAGDGVPA